MKATIKVQISPTGEVKILTVQGVGTGCRAVTDSLGQTLGQVDESSRGDTDDIYQTGEQDTVVTA